MPLPKPMESPRRLEAMGVFYQEALEGPKDPRKALENTRSRRKGKEGLGREER